jgi:hypothetical protein
MKFYYFIHFKIKKDRCQMQLNWLAFPVLLWQGMVFERFFYRPACPAYRQAGGKAGSH